MFVANNITVTITRQLSRLFLVSMLGFIVMTGCAINPQTPTKDPQDANQQVTIADNLLVDQQGWWQVSFHRNYQQGDDVMWYLGTLLAYEVIKPVIDTNQQLRLWRFHQRAKEDQSGHKFSFVFYSARSDAEKIHQYVKDNALVKQLLTDNYIERISFFEFKGKDRSAIENTSDKSWPLELQRSWPYFIMGASQTWLSLIDEFYQQEQISEEPDLAQQVELFKKLNDKINQVWEQKGHHAFLHHLNALFGYQELYIIDRRLMRF